MAVGGGERNDDAQRRAAIGAGLEAHPAAQGRDALAHAEQAHAGLARGIAGPAVVIDGQRDFVWPHRQMDADPGGVGVLGGVGERLLHDAIEIGADRGGQGLEGAVELGRQACSAGAAGLLLMPPYFFRYGQDDIRCNVICPGPVRTDMLEMNIRPLADALGTDMDGAFEQMSQFVPRRKWAAPRDMAGLFVFLASDESDFMTGSTLVMDGGIHIVDAFAAGVGQLGGEWG